MTPSELISFLHEGESLTLELKSAFNARAVAETVCAMLNAEGGQIVIGVTEVGEVVGIDSPEKRSEELNQLLRKKLSPAASWSIVVEEAEGKYVLIIDVPSGSAKPYVFDGVIVQRSGASNRRASAEDIRRLIQVRSDLDQHWERQPAVGFTIEDLDAEEIRRTVREASNSSRLDPAAESLPLEGVLTRLGLVSDGRLLQAAVVAFARSVLPSYPQCRLRLARFRGITKDEFLDQRRVVGHAFHLLEEASAFLNRHLPVRGTFTSDDLRRQDQPLYPPLALREALVNAFCHRDYAVPGGAVSVAIFDDRLEIASTGNLPSEFSVADLKKEHFSRPRNPLLADIFYRRGLIELWGRGTQNIVRLCVDAGGREPDFDARAGEFVVRFYSPSYLTPPVAGLDLTDRQRRILDLFQGGGKRSFGEIKEYVDPLLPDSTLRGDLKLLRDHGLLESTGVGRGASWRTVQVSPSV